MKQNKNQYIKFHKIGNSCSAKHTDKEESICKTHIPEKKRTPLKAHLQNNPIKKYTISQAFQGTRLHIVR
jgi:hypothetical protein